MASSDRRLEIDGEGAFWAVAGFAASVVVGVALRPLRESAGLENVVVVYVIVVALTAAIGGRAAGLASSLSAALAYNYFFTTPYETLRIDSLEQVATVVLLFVAGLLASLGGRATRRARVEAREEADVLQLLTAVNLAAARGGQLADGVAAHGLHELLQARAVRVVRDGPDGGRVVAEAGQLAGELDLDSLPHLDEEGRIPSGHLRSVGGTLVLPAEGAVIDLVRRNRKVGSLGRPRRGPPHPAHHPHGHRGNRARPGQRPLRAYDQGMAATRRRGTRPDFKPDWEPFSLPEDEVLRRGGALFDGGIYWEAHEVWEEVWRMRKGRPDRDFLKGIIQGAAGMWHATQGNYKGAVSVMSRAVEYLEPYRPAKDGIDVERLSAALSEAVAACAAALDGGPAPRLRMIRLELGDGR